MAEPVIVATSRTPIGRASKGSLVDARPDDMSAFIVKDVLSKVAGLDPAEVEGYEEFNKNYENKKEEEEVSITEDEVTPTIIEDVKITDLSDDDAKKKT